ncbi:hypothetical protein EB796_005680 [Bugula neritina]|uniref:Uncharacterized protein n=1 Tax=Bugula neritina TaxID=10212 RepID=A0A7J7KDS3_BUGNE|nr:hypothetical protein EB796_005680 [Bugula neritina]
MLRSLLVEHTHYLLICPQFPWKQIDYILVTRRWVDRHHLKRCVAQPVSQKSRQPKVWFGRLAKRCLCLLW